MICQRASMLTSCFRASNHLQSIACVLSSGNVSVSGVVCCVYGSVLVHNYYSLPCDVIAALQLHSDLVSQLGLLPWGIVDLRAFWNSLLTLMGKRLAWYLLRLAILYRSWCSLGKILWILGRRHHPPMSTGGAAHGHQCISAFVGIVVRTLQRRNTYSNVLHATMGHVWSLRGTAM